MWSTRRGFSLLSPNYRQAAQPEITWLTTLIVVASPVVPLHRAARLSFLCRAHLRLGEAFVRQRGQYLCVHAHS
jgi:hypothetical protein